MGIIAIYGTSSSSFDVQATADTQGSTRDIKWYWGIGSAGSSVKDSANCYTSAGPWTSHATGLSPGTYQIKVEFLILGSVFDVQYGSYTIAGTAPPPLPSAPSLYSVTGTSSSFSASWSNGANTSYCKVWLQGYGTYTTSSGATSFSTSVSLSPAKYFVQIIPVNSQGEGTYSNTLSFVVTVPPPSGLTGLIASGNNGYVHLQWNSSSGATNYNVSWSGFSSGSSSTSSTSMDVFLANNHYYTFTVTPTNSGGNGSSQSASATPSNRPSNFSWSTPKVSGANFALTATEWNSFFNTMNGFRDHVGLAPYSFTPPAAGGSFYADMFNQAVTAINAMSPPTAIPSSTASVKSSGDTIYAAYLNHLVTSLNSIP